MFIRIKTDSFQLVIIAVARLRYASPREKSNTFNPNNIIYNFFFQIIQPAKVATLL
jgi:hypothetical protein